MISPVANASPSRSRFLRRTSSGLMPSSAASASIVRSDAHTDCIAP
jgi:hypothetical protein